MPYSETNSSANYIGPALREKNWQYVNIPREYSFTDGRKLFGDKRGQRYFVDYLEIHYSLSNRLSTASGNIYKCKE